MSASISSTQFERSSSGDSYRALCFAAILSLICGLVSIVAFLDWTMAVVPLLGLLFGIRALWQIKRNPEELTGKTPAWSGIGLSLLFWGLGWSWLGFSYLNEIPEGFRPVDFAMLQPPELSNTLTNEEALALDGQRVFIRGYMRPGSQSSRITKFLLVRDNGVCCFGPVPKLTDMIQVELPESLRQEYSTKMFRVAGTMYVNKEIADDAQFAEDSNQVLFRMDVEYVR